MNDDTLILYYYGDGLSDDERAEVAAALERDGSLRERYRALQRSLERFNEPPVAPAPEQAVARWHRTIERAAARERVAEEPAGWSWHLPSFAWGALAAALVAAIAVGFSFRENTAPGPIIAETRDGAGVDEAVPEVAPASFSRGLQVHLRESREDLVRLAANGNTDRAMLIMDIMRQNRMFERAAQQHEAEDVARILRAFELILLRLADENVSAAEAAALKAQLVFELDAMLTKMEQRESDDTDSI